MRKYSFILVLLILLVSTGCSSLSSWVRSNLEGVPVWVYEPQVSRDQRAFVGSGTAATEVRSRIMAYESILKQISNVVGEDVVGVHIAELSSREAIEEYRLKVTQEFVKPGDGSVTVYFLAIADRDVLEKARTDAEVQQLEKQRSMDTLAQEAATAFRENRDMVAAFKYLEIAEIAASLPVDRGQQQYLNAIERVQEILDTLRIMVLAGDPSIPNATITVRRGTRALSPRVVEATVTAHSSARDGMGEVYDDSQRFVTDSDGQFIYTSNNPTLVGQGTIGFTLDMGSHLDFLENRDRELYASLKSLLEGKKIEYPYLREPLLGIRNMPVAISEYTYQGELLGSAYAGTALVDTFAKDGIAMNLVKAPMTEDDEDTILVLGAAYPDTRLFIYGNVGVSHTKSTNNGFAVTVAGEALLVDLEANTIRGRTGNVVANAIAPTEATARSAAFGKYGSISASLLYRYLYR
jgi:hypothetical protein